MSTLEKLVARFLREPPDVRFQEVFRLLKAFNYELYSTKGSHSTFIKPGSRPITVPIDKGRRVKKVYVHKINELLELEDWYEERKG